jgi:hypothetical protein
VLAPVHDPADGRPGGRSHLDQVEALLARAVSSDFYGDDADLTAVGVDQADGADADVVVYSGSRACYDLLLAMGRDRERPAPLAPGTTPNRKIGSGISMIFRPRRLSEGARARLRAALGATSPTLPFAEAVVMQMARPAGDPPDAARERDTALRVARLLALRERPPSVADRRASSLLQEDAVLLAAFFQNVDLLYDAGDPEADRVSRWIMTALERPGSGA